MKIFLIGFMGTGKSAVANTLSQSLQIPVLDMDNELVRRAGKSIPDIFEEEGEEGFRNREANLLKELSLDGEEAIISCGGGVVLRPENREILKKQNTILLTATPETVALRAGGDANRPLLRDTNSPEEIRKRMDAREAFYQECAKVVIATDNSTPEISANKVIKALGI